MQVNARPVSGLAPAQSQTGPNDLIRRACQDGSSPPEAAPEHEFDIYAILVQLYRFPWALALSLPESEWKPAILTATYVVVVFSIVVQGLTVGPLIRRVVKTG